MLRDASFLYDLFKTQKLGGDRPHVIQNYLER